MKAIRFLFALLLIFFISTSSIYSQGLGVNDDGAQPDNSAMLDVVSLTKGVLIPRMTTNDQLAISSPATGLLIFNTDSVNFWFFDGTVWRAICNCDIISVPPIICPDSITDSRDGQVYKAVLIGTQCWMKENLNLGSMIGSGGNQSSVAGTYQKYCYNNNTANCTAEGGLYQWRHAMQDWDTVQVLPVQGICPTGWHIPSNAERDVLIAYLANNGDKLKKAGLCQGRPNCGASGFDALLTGNRGQTGTFYYQGLVANFYTSSQSTVNTDLGGFFSTRIDLPFGTSISTGEVNKLVGFSIRCIKD